jgi:type IV secretory pathway ATPase VirB11/archaellum biosynthesis ATPase
MKIEADIEASIIRSNAQARLNVAKNKSEALIKEANAEEKAASSLESVRRFNEKMKLAAGLESLAKKGHMVISGENGKQVLDYFNSAIDLINSR